MLVVRMRLFKVAGPSGRKCRGKGAFEDHGTTVTSMDTP